MLIKEVTDHYGLFCRSKLSRHDTISYPRRRLSAADGGIAVVMLQYQVKEEDASTAL
jgi:hypothetical protein